MQPLRLLPGVLSVLILSLSTASAVRGDQPAAGKGPNSTDVAAKPAEGRLREILRDALETIKAIEREAAKSDRFGIASFEGRMLGEPKAQALAAIGIAQAKVGDRDA